MFAARGTLLTRHALAGSPSTSIPTQLHWDFTAATPQTISTTGVAAPTGQLMDALNIGSDIDIGASTLDSTVVCRDTAGTGSYLTTVSALAGTAFMGAKFRFNNTGASSNVCSLGIICWVKRSPISGDLSSTHLVIDYNAQTVRVQTVTDGGVTFNTIGGPWSVTMAANTWYTLEYAVAGSTMAIKMPDGTYQGFTDSALSSIGQNYPSFEPFYAGGRDATDVDPEIAEIWASTVAGCNTAQLAYINALLAQKGYGPLSPPPSPATYLGSNIALAGAATTSFSHTSSDLLVALPICFSSNTIPDLESGYTDVGISQGLNTISGRPQYKNFANSSAETCTFTTGQDATHVTVAGFSHAAVGASAKFCSSLATIATPALTLQVTDGSSRVLYGYVTRGTLGSPPAAPAGSTRIAVIDNPSTGGDMAVYLTDAGVSSWAGASLATGTASGFYSWAIEIKAA